MDNRFLNLILTIASLIAGVLLLAAAALIAFGQFGAIIANSLAAALFTGGFIFSLVTIAGSNFLQLRLRGEMRAACKLTQTLAQGNIARFEPQNELQEQLREILDYLSEKTAIMDKLSDGDLAVYAAPRSDADMFGKSLKRLAEGLEASVGSLASRDRLRDSVLKLLDEVSGVAAGDLTVHADVNADETGEIAEAFNSMTRNFRSLIRQVKDVTAQVAAAANSINDTTEQLAQGSATQASQIARTTLSVTDITTQIQEVADNSTMAVQVAEESLQNARYGTAAARDNINAMNSIRRQVQETAKRIKKLGERSQEIGQIVTLIDDLSDRTSLLALNASLQISSGGNGGGLGMVAEEVERLAERTAQLTQQIAMLTQTMNFETKEVVSSMEETIREVIVGSALADKAGKSLVDIEMTSRRLSDLLNSVSASAKNQSRKSDEISKSMSDISEVTDLVQSGARRAADSMKILVRLSGDLRNSVAPFKLPTDLSVASANPPENGAFIN